MVFGTLILDQFRFLANNDNDNCLGAGSGFWISFLRNQQPVTVMMRALHRESVYGKQFTITMSHFEGDVLNLTYIRTAIQPSAYRN